MRTRDRLFGSISIVLDEVRQEERADLRKIGMHLLGVAICLEQWPDDQVPSRYFELLRDNRRRAALQVRILCSEVSQHYEEDRPLPEHLAERIEELLREITSGKKRAVRCFEATEPVFSPRICWV